MLFRNLKNGRLYRKFGDVIDCTNGREDTPMTLYGDEHGAAPKYVRTTEEFSRKFEPLKEPRQS